MRGVFCPVANIFTLVPPTSITSTFTLACVVLLAKARALLKDRAHVTLEDIQTLADPTLRHRVLLNYRAEAEGVTVESVVQRLLETIKPPFGK